jgi:shikimate kinase
MEPPPANARAVFLVGFMASGKTTVGAALARRLAWDFVDLDAEIEIREGKAIAEIFRDRGESEFRLIEAAALRELTEALERDTVIALGGGAFAQSDNLELLKPWPSIFLDAPVEELWRRSQQEDKKRPLRNNFPDFVRLHENRLPFYRKAQVTIVTSGRDQTSLCAEIESILQFWDKSASAVSSQAPQTRFETGETK